MTDTERAAEMANELIKKSEKSMTFDEALEQFFAGRPDLYHKYREESLARKPREEAAARPTVNKTVGEMAAEGIAKQLIATSAASDMDDAIAQTFKLRPDLYARYRQDGFSHLR